MGGGGGEGRNFEKVLKVYKLISKIVDRKYQVSYGQDVTWTKWRHRPFLVAMTVYKTENCVPILHAFETR